MSPAKTAHVVHLIPWLKTGGSENLLRRHVAELSRSWPEYRNTVLVLGREQASEAIVGEFACRVGFLGLPADYRRPWVFLRGLSQLRAVLRELHADVVHSYLLAADLYAAAASRLEGLRHVAHVLDRRGQRDAGSLRSRLRVRMLGRLLRWSRARLVAVSDACREHALVNYRVAADSIQTAHNGIDIDSYSPPAQGNETGPLRIGAISRMAAEKGHQFLYGAIRSLHELGINCELRLAGPGSDGPATLAALQSYGIEDLSTPLGRVPSVADFYRELDVFAISSVDAEGLPTTILEAMASALPVVATDVGGAREAIIDGDSGLLVPPGDSAALCGALRQLADDPVRRAVLGTAARERVRHHFTTAAMTRTIVDHAYRYSAAERAGAVAGTSS